jgi:hypothetical protein
MALHSDDDSGDDNDDDDDNEDEIDKPQNDDGLWCTQCLDDPNIKVCCFCGCQVSHCARTFFIPLHLSLPLNVIYV